MHRRSLKQWLVLSVFLLLPAVLAFNLTVAPQPVARGKAATLPLSDQMDAEQQLAQSLALADARVQALTVGQRTEVFGVQRVGQHFTAAASACASADCRQVNIFNFDEAATVAALVNVDTREVLDVLHQPGHRPGIPKRLADRAMEIALNAPEVIEVLGYQPAASDWAPMDSSLVGSACTTGHMCVAPTFDLGDYILWAIVDLTDERFVKLFWTSLPPEDVERGVAMDTYQAGGCPPGGTATRDGWSVPYETTNSDGFRVYNVTFNGVPVLTSAKNAEWHADYGSAGYQDSTGCGDGGGGFPIYPYGNTEQRDLLDGGNVVGFELVQDFRMGGWGSGCNYRYEQHFQFFNDGRFRVVAGAYGKGCGVNSVYRPVVRIDVAVNGDANDSYATWDGAGWAPQATELRTGAGNLISPEGYAARVLDSSGAGFYLEPGRGQFGDEGRGDSEFIYAVRHRPSEGDSDLGVFTAGCCDDDNHGPEIYVNDEAIADTNIVLWYVPQMRTVAEAPDYYCWTIQGEPNPITYPCFAGPMFVPFEAPEAPTASFSSNSPVNLGSPAIFTNTSTGDGLSYTWDFGDGFSSTEENPTHLYAAAGLYDVTLTVSNPAGTSVASAPFEVLAPTAVTLERLDATPTGRSWAAWSFGAAGLLLAGVALRRAGRRAR